MSAARLFWLLALGGYIVLHVAFEMGLSLGRPTMYEVDDQYHFLVKAHNTQYCRQKDCPGLNDLYTQTGLPPADAITAMGQIQVRHRALIAYHPLHSAGILAVQKATGLTPERSQMVWNVLLHIGAGLTVAFLLQGLFGTVAAGVGLLMLSAIWMNPSSWAMTPFLASCYLVLAGWAALVQKPFRGQLALTWLFLTASCGMHTAGVVGTGLTMGWPALSEGFQLRKRWPFYIAAAASAVFFFKWQMQFVPAYIDYKTIYAEHSFKQVVVENLWALRDVLQPVAEQYGLPMLLLGVGVALFTLPTRSRRQMGAIALAGIGLVGLSLIYPSPYISLLHRLWHLIAVPWVGALAYMLVWSLRHATWPTNLWATFKGWMNGTASIPAKQLSTGVLATGLAVLTSATVLYAGVFGGMQVPYAFKNMLHNKDVVFNPAVVQQALRETSPTDRIVFDIAKPNLSANAEETQEAVIYFGLVHGLTARGMAIAPYLRTHPEALAPLRPNLKFMLQTNPVVTLLGSDWILSTTPLHLSWDTPTTTLKLHSPQAWKGHTVHFQTAEGTPVTGTADFAGWLTLTLPQPTTGGTLTLAGGQPIRLSGMALNDTVPTTFWPWNQGLKLGWQTAGETAPQPMSQASFSLPSLAPFPGCTVETPVWDADSLVLLPIECTASSSMPPQGS